jgi:hypothetical protein
MEQSAVEGHFSDAQRRNSMHSIIYIIGLIVVIAIVLSFLGVL